MIAISSFKPFADSEAVAENQLAAKETWEQAFAKIVYFVPEPEPELASDKTWFIRSEAFPRILELMEFASSCPDWACIINADIQVSFRLRWTELELKRRKAQSAVSKRYQLPEAKVLDLGIDFFAAEPELWAKLTKHVPKVFRIGHILWDTWTLSAFTTLGNPRRCYDITKSKCIFHPQHGDRVRPHGAPVVDNPMLKIVRWPGNKLDIFSRHI